jgi:hypothetical protein
MQKNSQRTGVSKYQLLQQKISRNTATGFQRRIKGEPKENWPR